MRFHSLVADESSATFLSKLDPRIKLVLLVAFVATLSLWKEPANLKLLGAGAMLLAITLAGRLPLKKVLLRGFLVLPFIGLFGLVLYLSGQPDRALLIFEKSYLSTWSVLLIAGSTPPTKLISAARDLHVPNLLSEVTQLTFRYLFVLREEAVAMQIAFRSRAGGSGIRAALASSGMVAGLFLRSQQRAERVYHSMLSRGYTGHPPQRVLVSPRPFDYFILTLGLLVFGSSLLL